LNLTEDMNCLALKPRGSLNLMRNGVDSNSTIISAKLTIALGWQNLCAQDSEPYKRSSRCSRIAEKWADHRIPLETRVRTRQDLRKLEIEHFSAKQHMRRRWRARYAFQASNSAVLRLRLSSNLPKVTRLV